MTTKRPITVSELFPSRYLKHEDIGNQDLSLTISAFSFELVGKGDQAEQKGCLSFIETSKKLVLNKTNATTISHLYGNKMEDWTGKKIALYKTEVPFGGNMVQAIRVRKASPDDQQPLEQGVEPSGPVYPT